MAHPAETTQTHTTTTTTSGGGGGSRQCHSSSCCCVWKLMRKLKKQSNKMLCMATRPPAFDCHYDPLSYARNFDDSSHFLYAFSSRFVGGEAAKKPLVHGNNVTR